MAGEITTQVWVCAQCSATFTGRKRKYCSASCGVSVRHRKRYPRAWADYAADAAANALRRTCPHCGKDFARTRGDSHRNGPQVHCSRKCSDVARSERLSAAAMLTALINREKRIYAKWAKAAAKRAAAQAEDVRLNHCRHCGCYLIDRIKHQTLCPMCTAAGKRKSRASSKLRRRGAVVERFDPVEVLERDGWRCHLCGIKTPKRLRGGYAPNAPELDHIVPIAAGGEHSRRNTACACRKCNGEKGAKPMGQLRLVA